MNTMFIFYKRNFKILTSKVGNCKKLLEFLELYAKH